jgi:pyridoxal 5'-phosphate synthase pdxT subunit
MTMMRKVGVLALQGDFAKHAHALTAAGACVSEVRVAEDLQSLEGLVIPGGESTTMTLLLRDGLRAAVEEFCRTIPVWGTCAGMIMLAKSTDDPRVLPLGFLDIEVQRNGFGRQVHSFEADLRVADELGEPHKPLHGIFIRAPRVVSMGAEVKPLIWRDTEVVCVRQRNLLASAFHPELTGDLRLQRYFLSGLS